MYRHHMREVCVDCGLDLRAGTRAFADRRHLPGGSLRCGECATAHLSAHRPRPLVDVNADTAVRQGAGLALYWANQHG